MNGRIVKEQLIDVSLFIKVSDIQLEIVIALELSISYVNQKIIFENMELVDTETTLNQYADCHFIEKKVALR